VWRHKEAWVHPLRAAVFVVLMIRFLEEMGKYKGGSGRETLPALASLKEVGDALGSECSSISSCMRYGIGENN
jgi:hypothetical protein